MFKWLFGSPPEPALPVAPPPVSLYRPFAGFSTPMIAREAIRLLRNTGVQSSTNAKYGYEQVAVWGTVTLPMLVTLSLDEFSERMVSPWVEGLVNATGDRLLPRVAPTEPEDIFYGDLDRIEESTQEFSEFKLRVVRYYQLKTDQYIFSLDTCVPSGPKQLLLQL